jgi:hypothetical protein
MKVKRFLLVVGVFTATLLTTQVGMAWKLIGYAVLFICSSLLIHSFGE